MYFFEPIFHTRKIDKICKDFLAISSPHAYVSEPNYSNIPELCIAYKMNQHILGQKL